MAYGRFNTLKFNQPATNPVEVSISLNGTSSITATTTALRKLSTEFNGTSTTSVIVGVQSKFMSTMLATSAVEVKAVMIGSIAGGVLGTSAIDNTNIVLTSNVATNINDISNITITIDNIQSTAMEFVGSSDMTAVVNVINVLSAAMNGVSNIEAKTTALLKVASDLADTSAIENTVIVARQVGISINGGSAMIADLHSSLAVSGLFGSESNIVVSPNVLASSVITIQDTSHITGGVQAVAAAAIMITGTSNVSGSIMRSAPISSNVYGVSDLNVRLATTRNMVAVMNGTSAMTIKFANSLRDEFNEPSRQIEAFVEIYFDPDNPEIISYDIIDFSLLEELKADTNNPVGDITANEFVLSIDNTLRRFSPTNSNSDLYGRLVPGIKIKPYLTILSNGDRIHEDIELGTFYSGDWDSPSQSVTCTVTCNDKLYTIMNLPFKGIKIVKNTTYAELYTKIFAAANLLPADYKIDTLLNGAVKMAHIPAGTIGTALKRVSEASGSYVYTSREDTIQAKLVDYTAAKITLDDLSNQIISHEAPTRYLETYANINVPYYTPSIASDVSVATISDYVLEAGENIITDVSFSNSPVVRVTKIEIQGAPDAKVKYYEATSDILVSLCIMNAGDATTAQITVYGESCTYTSIGVSAQDSSLIPYVSSKELKIENTLIQTKEHAEWHINRLAQITHNPCPTLSLNIRGNPFIMLTSIVDVTDERYGIVNQNIMITRSVLEYAGGLSGSLTGYILPQEVI